MTKDVVPISVIALRAEHYSTDGKSVIISLTTKYSAVDRKYSVPIECFFDFIADLQRLNAFADRTPTQKPIETTVGPKGDGDLTTTLATTRTVPKGAD
jgi:hypothetical protein